MSKKHPLIVPGYLFFFLFVFIFVPRNAYASIKISMQPGLAVELTAGNEIIVSACPAGECDIQEWADRLLANPEKSARFVKGKCLRIPFSELVPEYQLDAIKTLFPKDKYTDDGWTHKVTYFSGRSVEGETLWSISKWFTGNPQNYVKIRSYNNLPPSGRLTKSSIIRISLELLSPAFKDVVTFDIAARHAAEEGSAKRRQLNGELTLKMDEQGPYASYRLKRGDTLYSRVVMTFTDRVTPEDVMEATGIICDRSGLKDPRKLKAGDEIKIPLDLLSVMYLPPDDPRRIEYEQLQKETAKISNPVRTEDLKGIIVILDPGHGGNDPGTLGHLGKGVVFEDEFVYDVVCRIKDLLETTTMAKVEMTLEDKSDRYEPVNYTSFKDDTDEYVLTTPVYRNHDAKVAANLRWYLANSVFRRVTSGGVDPDKVVFVSFHADSLYSDARGTMIYVPGTYLCTGNGGKDGYVYTSRAEVREDQYVQLSHKARVRSEGLSTDLAKHIVRSLQKQKIGVHPVKPIRNQVVRRRHAYVPVVIRHNIVPTKILVEILNMNNREDCMLSTDPEYRQNYAIAFVQALKNYYGDR